MFFVRVLRFRGIDGLVIRPNEGEADGNESCETERCSQGRVYGSDGELRVDNRLAFVNDVLSATGCSQKGVPCRPRMDFAATPTFPGQHLYLLWT